MAASAETIVRLPDPKAAFDHLTTHALEHGVDGEMSGPSSMRFKRMGCQIEFAHFKDALKIDVRAPTKSLLYFLKEAAARHVCEFDPIAGEALRWSRDGDAAPEPVNFCTLRLAARHEVYPGMVRLTLAGEGGLGLEPDGYHVKLLVPADRLRLPVWPSVGANGVTQWPTGQDRLHVRYYTIRALRPEIGEIDIDVVQHKDGRISDWASTAQPGEIIGVMGPSAGELPSHPEALLLAGDETALPAIARILGDLNGSGGGCVVVAYPVGLDPSHYFPDTPLNVITLPPHRFRNEVFDRVRTACRDVTIKSAWFGGEFENAQQLRRFFKQELGLSKENQLSVAYWREGERGDAEI